MLIAAERGYLDVVQWLYAEFKADPTINLFWVYGYSGSSRLYASPVDLTVANGHLETVQYLLQVESEDADEEGKIPNELDIL
ncbi:hypothetical protein PHYPSEUDO_010884 [Phytophthora pseudosyringae]|uniref:Uncharacterized protein n=1 Tax=Phytophthora pseudosyringae TaxID=221518 RepID=A0A8T1VC85_9STRA|nr:hypothetical protein PHYPSEUDO_010884 [Phytophthora pseudosyringae]